MDGFRVETMELAGLGSQYHAVSRGLADDMSGLQRAIRALSTQTVGDEVPALLRTAVQTLAQAIDDTQELARQCGEIATAYERTEQRVAAVVAALPSKSPFDAPAAAGSRVAPARVRVQSRYHAAPTAAILSGNRLPCEGWLLQRTLRAGKAE